MPSFFFFMPSIKQKESQRGKKMPCIADADERHGSIQSGVSTPSEESIRSGPSLLPQEIPSTASLHFYNSELNASTFSEDGLGGEQLSQECRGTSPIMSGLKKKTEQNKKNQGTFLFLTASNSSREPDTKPAKTSSSSFSFCLISHHISGGS